MQGSRFSTDTHISFIWFTREVPAPVSSATPQPKLMQRFAPLYPLRQWLDTLEIRDRRIAHQLCRLIPTRCPFERTITVAGRTLLRIPPLCKLNPLYEQVVGLRFRALCYLADECGEDVSAYC